MAQFNQLVMTNQWIALFNKVQLGAALQFTKVSLGDGELAQGQTLQSLTNLIHKIMDLTILSTTRGNGEITVKVSFSNQSLLEGIHAREIGVYAQDPDVGEILYCIANAGSLADYIPTYSVSPVEYIVNLIIRVGNATNVTAQIDQSLAFATKTDLDKLKTDIYNAFSDLLQNGVHNMETDFIVTYPLNMTLILGNGSAWINGTKVIWNQSSNVGFDLPDTQPRYDLISIGLMSGDPFIMIVKGQPSADPNVPVVDNTDDVDLYAVRINPGATSITPADVVDLRQAVSVKIQ